MRSGRCALPIGYPADWQTPSHFRRQGFSTRPHSRKANRPPQGWPFYFLAGGEGLTRPIPGPRPRMCSGRCALPIGYPADWQTPSPFRRQGFSTRPRSRKAKRPPRGWPFYFLAGGEGFEPPLAESESAVLPLDDPPMGSKDYRFENCTARRALCRPTFLRSTSRASRVT